MKDSVYTREVRSEVLKSGITRHYRVLPQEQVGGRKLYWLVEEMNKARDWKEMMNRA